MVTEAPAGITMGGCRATGIRNPITADLVIRDGAQADLGRIVELLSLGAVPGAPADVEDAADLGRYASALNEIEDAGDAVLVAEVGGLVVGVCQLIVLRHLQHRGGRCAESSRCTCTPTSGGGASAAPCSVTPRQRARRLGCYRVQLTSDAVRHDAHRFYERLGFAPSHVGFKMLLD